MIKKSRAINRLLKAKRIYEEFRENSAIKLFAKKKLSVIAEELDEESRAKFCEIMNEKPASKDTWNIVIVLLQDDEEHGK